mgnify:CR=1 FL=1
MKVGILTGCGEPVFSTNFGLVYGFRELGHEVCVVGPSYWGRFSGDIELPDKKHPELYSYGEVLEKLPWTPDLLLNIEPHGFLVGPKPPEIRSAFYFTDAHRAGLTYYRIASRGNFDFVICGQPYFTPLFTDIPNTRVVTIPPGFDTRRFPKQDSIPSPLVDIVFVGQTGIAAMEYPYEDECGLFATRPPGNLSPSHERYAFRGHPGYDYAERAELLIRLSRDFNVRMYDAVWETPKLQQALQKGAIVFNMSLLHDVSIRCYETFAAGRFLMTDDVPKLQEAIGHIWHGTYDCQYKVFFPNFDLTYHALYIKIKDLLNFGSQREKIAKYAFDYAQGNHPWTTRARAIINLM